MKNYLILTMVMSVFFGGTLFASQETFHGDWNITFVGVGPSIGDTGWWSADVTADRPTFADDVHTFNSDGSFSQNMQDATWVEAWQDGDPEGSRAAVAPHDGSNPATWSYDADAGTVTVTGVGAYLGVPKAHNGGELIAGAEVPSSRTYIVTQLSATQMILDIDYNNGGGYWRSILTNMNPSVGLPVDFEISVSTFDGYNVSGFGGGVATVEAAPEGSNALKYVKGSPETWAGVQIDLDTGVNSADGDFFYASVYSTVARSITFKLDTVNIERAVQHTGTGWEQLVFDFSGESYSANSRIAFFNDLSQAGDGSADWTIYIDDIEQAASVPNPLITDTSGTLTTSGNQDFMLEYQASRDPSNLETHRSETWLQAGEWYGGESGILLYFPVPNLGTIADPFTNTELGVKLDNFGSADYDADLAFMGVVSNTALPAEFYDRSTGTVIMDAFLTQSNESFGLAGLPGGPQIFTDATANASLTSALNTAYDSGNAVGSYFAFRIMTDIDPIAAGGNWSIRASEQAGEGPVLNWTTDGSALPFTGSDAGANLASLRSGGLGTQKTVYFNIQNAPHPDTTPNFDTDRVTISSTVEQAFTIEIPAYEDSTYPANHEFSNWIFYIENAGGYAVAINDLVLEIGDSTWGASGVQNSLIFEENFGGSQYNQIGDDHVYYFPSEGNGLQTWAGFALLGYDGLYPLVFDNGATLTFNAKLVDPSIIPEPNVFEGEQAFSDGQIDFSPRTENPYKWSAYIEWFALDEDGEQGAREEGATQDDLQDLQVTTVFDANGDITLEPNSALYRPGSMWQGDDGDGTRWVINSLRIEGDAGTSDLLGNDVSFSGTIATFDIDPRYDVTVNIKLLDANNNYASVGFPATHIITQAGDFNLSLPMPDDGNYVPQLSFDIAGINANPDTDWGQMTITNLVGSYGSLNAIDNANFHYGTATSEANSISYWSKSTEAEVSYVNDDGIGLRPGALRLDNTAYTNRDSVNAITADVFTLEELEVTGASTIYGTYNMKRVSGNDLGLLELEFLDASGNHIGYAPDYTTYVAPTPEVADGEWDEYSQTFDVPAGTASIGLAFFGGVESDVLFDSVKLASQTTSTYSDWVANYPTLADSTWESDSDGDGLNDGLEHVLGTDPTTANSSVVSDFTVAGSEATFKHSVNTYADPNSSISYSWSRDLENWYDDGGEDGSGISVEITDYVILGEASVRANVSASSAALEADPNALDSVNKLFIRLNATYTEDDGGSSVEVPSNESLAIFAGDWTTTYVAVGPSKGAADWWSSDFGDRPTQADDVTSFNSDGTFSIDYQDATWVEQWQDGQGDGSRAAVAPHDSSNSASWSYDAVAGTLTLNGQGAHIGVPKATNGAQLGADSAVPTSRTYQVTVNSDTEIVFDIETDTGVWWTATLTKVPPAGLDIFGGDWTTTYVAVGPSKGAADWWSSDFGDRPTQADDVTSFNANGSFSIDYQDATWVEQWQDGQGDGSRAAVAPHDSSNYASWSYDAVAGTLTLNGQGAHIGVPKATNGAQLGADSAVPTSRTYQVTVNSDTEIVFDMETDTGVWWTATLTKVADGSGDTGTGDTGTGDTGATTAEFAVSVNGASTSATWNAVADATSTSEANIEVDSNGALSITGVNPVSTAGKAYIWETNITVPELSTEDLVIEISAKTSGALASAAAHVLSGAPVPGANLMDIQGSLNDSTYSTVTHTITGVTGGTNVNLQLQIAAGAVENAGGTILIESITITQEAGSGDTGTGDTGSPFEAPSNAPTPSVTDADVLTIYSTSLTSDVTNLDTNAQWGQTGTSVVTATGLTYRDLDYQGTTFDTIDVRGYTDLHLDFYADENCNTLQITIIGGGETLVDVQNPVVSGQWNSVDIALADFTNVNQEVVNQMKVVGNGNVALDNIYFHGSSGFVDSGVTIALPVDFEQSADEYTIAGFDGGVATIEASIDGGSNALKYVKGAGANWAGVWINLDTAVDETAGNSYTANVHSTVARTITMKFDAANVESSATHSGSGWETLTFNFANGTPAGQTKIAFFNDLSQAGDGSADWTIYIDDLAQN